MKKLFPYLTILLIVVVIALLFVSMSTSQNMTVVYTGNTQKKAY